MFDFFKTEKKQYLNSVCVDLRYLYPSEEKWNDFISIMRKKHKNIESEIPGLLIYYHNNEYLTEKMVKALVATEFYEYNNRKKSIWNKGNNKRVLNLNEKPYTTTYLFMATRIAIMQEYEVAREYLMCHMMNFYICPEDEDMNFIYFDFDINRFLDVKEESFSDIEGINIINYIREKIDEGIFINIHLDEYYLSCKEIYQKKHFVHENLVYGYDDNSEEIYIYGIDNNHRYSKIKVKYTEVMEGFERGKYYAFCGAKYLIDKYPWPITLFCLKLDKSDEEMDVKRFKDNLSDYILGNGLKNEERNMLWGSDANSFVIKEMKLGNKKNIIDFKTFQLISEHKDIVFNACKYLIEKQKGTEKDLKDLSGFLEKYKQVKKDFFLIKVEYMRLLINEGKFNNMDYIVSDTKNQEKIVSMLESAVNKEKEVVEEFLSK